MGSSSEYRKNNLAKAREYNRRYYASAKGKETCYRWRENNPSRVRATKQRYYATDAGKAAKQREDAAYVASGGRAASERRRASRPLSPARSAARLVYQLKRRTGEKMLSTVNQFVLREAVDLARIRSALTGIEWHVDHVIPVSKGGSSCYNNLQVVPALWNRKKSNRRIELFWRTCQ